MYSFIEHNVVFNSYLRAEDGFSWSGIVLSPSSMSTAGPPLPVLTRDTVSNSGSPGSRSTGTEDELV